MADPPAPEPAIEPRSRGPVVGESGGMNGFLDVGLVVSLALGAAFLLSGAALPFLSHERKDHR
jgi:hypothetical protein